MNTYSYYKVTPSVSQEYGESLQDAIALSRREIMVRFELSLPFIPSHTLP